jgi:hypothetical protein
LIGAAGSRHIHKRGAVETISDLLETIFAAELVAPSRCLWIVSPWISNIPILDNSAHAYLSVEPSWARASVRLAPVLHRLMDAGCEVVVATRPIAVNDAFLAQLDKGRDPMHRLTVHTSENLHTKGILGDRFYLSGSMNFTFHGIEVNEEYLHFSTEDATVAENQLEYRRWWGGAG